MFGINKKKVFEGKKLIMLRNFFYVLKKIDIKRTESEKIGCVVVGRTKKVPEIEPTCRIKITETDGRIWPLHWLRKNTAKDSIKCI